MVTQGMVQSMAGTHKWARFMSILGFVSAGFMIVAGVLAGAIGIGAGQNEAAVLLILYPALGLLYIIPSLHLYRFAKHGREFAAQNNPAELELALESNRAFWKFVGLLTAVMLILSVVMMVLAIGIGLAIPSLMAE